MDKLRELIKEYRWTVILAVAGLVLTILLFTIGFFKTLLLFAVVGVCVVLGLTLDREGIDGVKTLFGKIFKKGDRA